MHQQHRDRPTADALDRNEVRDQRLAVHRVGTTPSIALCAIAWMVAAFAAQKPQARSCPGSKAAIRAAAGNIDPARSLRRSIIASPAFRGQSLVCDRPLMVIIGTSLSLSTMPACPFGQSSTLRLLSWYRKAAIQS
jgi:predicted metal-binding membrane protein